MAHSPAPWKWSEYDPENYGTMPILFDANGIKIMDFGQAYFTDQLAGTEPNPDDAALIAAAPEMLSMLNELARYDDLMYKCDPYYSMEDEFRQRLNELIAKAQPTQDELPPEIPPESER